jgi:hypothetical protein
MKSTLALFRQPAAANQILLQAAALTVLGVGFSALLGFPQSKDVRLYQRYGALVLQGSVPYRDFDVEYPPLALLPMVLAQVPDGKSASAYGGYAHRFFSLNVLFAILTAVAIGRAASADALEGRAAAVLRTFALLVAVFSPLFPWRYDPFPAALTALALAAFAEKSFFAAGVWTGLGVAAKLYPVLILAVFGLHCLCRRRIEDVGRLTAGAVVALLAVFLPVVLLADGKAFSFLEFHQQRGIEIGSVPAGLLLLGHAIGAAPVQLVYSFGADHLVSPGADRLRNLLAPISVAAIGVALWRARTWMVRAWATRGAIDARTTATATFFVLLVAMATGKVLSPQFMVWLLPFIPFLPRGPRVLAVAVCGATILIFPFGWSAMVQLRLPLILLLNLRNAAMVALAVWLWKRPTEPEEVVLPAGGSGTAAPVGARA